MLRMLALALLLANAGYFAWGQGLLAAYGLKPARQGEPERLAQQIRPEALQLIAPAVPTLATMPGAPDAPTAAGASQPVARVAVLAPPPLPAGSACLQVGLFTAQQARLLRPRLQARLPKGSWSLESSGEPSQWIIYMGRYVSKEAMMRKRLKLQQLGLDFQPPASPLLNPGLSLGSFGSKVEAEDALAQMSQRGLRTARVVPERPELPSLWLRLPVADAALRTQLDALKPQFAGKAMQTCP